MKQEGKYGILIRTYIVNFLHRIHTYILLPNLIPLYLSFESYIQGLQAKLKFTTLIFQYISQMIKRHDNKDTVYICKTVCKIKMQLLQHCCKH